jgi:hypothetical protein
MKIILYLLISVSILCQKNSGFMSYNMYYDTNEHSVLTINTSIKINAQFSYFSLVNYFGNIKSGNKEEISSFYSEQNLRYKWDESLPLSITCQWNIRSDEQNDRLRLGLLWSLNKTDVLADFFRSLSMTYFINFHTYQFDSDTDYNWQLEHVYKFNFIPNLLYLAGFADHSFGAENEPKLVTEHQLGIAIFNQFNFVAEYRLNEYRAENTSSLGLGFEYLFIF